MTISADGSNQGMAFVAEVFRIVFIALLIGLLFAIDAHTPLGIGVGMFYAGIVFLCATSSYRRLPLFTATVASVLIPIGAAAAPMVEGFPVWIGIANRTLSLGMVWIWFWFVQYRRRITAMRASGWTANSTLPPVT